MFLKLSFVHVYLHRWQLRRCVVVHLRHLREVNGQLGFAAPENSEDKTEESNATHTKQHDRTCNKEIQQDKTRQDKTRQDEARHDKTKTRL